MKKILFILSGAVLLSLQGIAQNSPEDKKQEEFDKKFRFGIRATPQPTWFKSGNSSSTANGAKFGFGFGLIMEFKLSNIIHFNTGIGGDFEGGTIAYRNDKDFTVNAVLNNEGQYIEAKNGISQDSYINQNGNTQVILKERKYKSTYVTIPLILKMMTQEYSGTRYFAQFGGELGIRTGLKADDSYVSGAKTTVTGTNVAYTPLSDADLSKKGIDVNKDGSLIPMRIGMNLGGGIEYRLGGSTSLLFSASYFQSFTNLTRNDSKYLVKGMDTQFDAANKTYNFSALSQSYMMRAIRINIGILF